MSDLLTDVDGRRVTVEVARLYSRMRERPTPPYDVLGVDAAREVVEQSVRAQGPLEEVAEVTDTVIAGRSAPIPVRLYRPARRRQAPALIVFLHGGGWVTGSIAASDPTCRRLVNNTGCLVASVEYRRSPETRHPGPLEDVMDAMRELAAQRDSLGVADDRLVLVGDSAGGNLAAAAALTGDLTTDLVLFYPALVPPQSATFPSAIENADDPVLSLSSMHWFWSNYLPEGADTRDPTIAPLLSDRLAGTPRTFLVTCELDVLRDEGLAFARALDSAGVELHHRHLEGVPHGFLSLSKFIPEAQLSLVELSYWL